ncbi:hypothetical protein C8046_15560 [Serinibacter arcticus]|uniref:N-acetyltransferase domain-containing protein n=1 Tax=Serinibacter arcticus TaxID=1655435 RepID=A0A2U1ZY35_9MICO|nr:GNAT family N-acetyltransferase [Serinibacter arcticus]PWD51850.1 hypothetical protein C8046_15560 [Serinibacter arcticus]
MTTWRLIWESDLTPSDHTALAAMLARAFSSSDLGGRSWASERPEGRVVGYDDGGAPVAHAAFLRRFVRVGTGERREQVLVADVGLVAVEPARQGSGLGRALLTELARVAAGLRVEAGLLTTGEGNVGFYATGGWERTPTQLTRTFEADGSEQVWTEATLHLPLSGRAFPAGEIVRDGYEV